MFGLPMPGGFIQNRRPSPAQEHPYSLFAEVLPTLVPLDNLTSTSARSAWRIRNDHHDTDLGLLNTPGDLEKKLGEQEGNLAESVGAWSSTEPGRTRLAVLSIPERGTRPIGKTSCPLHAAELL